MSDQENLTPRERLVLRILLICAEIICGKSFRGGISGDAATHIVKLRDDILRGIGQ